MELFADIDKASGCVVLFTENGDIKAYLTDGKMKMPERIGLECESCVAKNMDFGRELARAWNFYIQNFKS